MTNWIELTMNSGSPDQHFPHVVNIDYTILDSDTRIKIHKWVIKTFGDEYDQYRNPSGVWLDYSYLYFTFKHDSDAVLCYLTWESESI